MVKMLAFMILVWLSFTMGGHFMNGTSMYASTTLEVALSADEGDTITVASTGGFGDCGYIKIGDEYIGYPQKTDTTFKSSWTQDMERGARGSDNTTHSIGAIVRTSEGAMINSSLNYQVATLTDASGILGFVTIPFKFIKLLLSFFIIEMDWLGPDLEIFAVVWGIVGIALLTVLGISVAGGRRV